MALSDRGLCGAGGVFEAAAMHGRPGQRGREGTALAVRLLKVLSLHLLALHGREITRGRGTAKATRRRAKRAADPYTYCYNGHKAKANILSGGVWAKEKAAEAVAVTWAKPSPRPQGGGGP